MEVHYVRKEKKALAIFFLLAKQSHSSSFCAWLFQGSCSDLDVPEASPFAFKVRMLFKLAVVVTLSHGASCVQSI